MEDNNLVFRESAYQAIAVVLCIFSLVGLLIWNRRCGRLAPKVALVAQISIIVSVIALIMALAIPKVT